MLRVPLAFRHLMMFLLDILSGHQTLRNVRNNRLSFALSFTAFRILKFRHCNLQNSYFSVSSDQTVLIVTIILHCQGCEKALKNPSLGESLRSARFISKL